MPFESIDKLQNMLAKDVFSYTKDPKKASGRALGTFVEIISFYLLESWGFSDYISIENGLIEYRNQAISHNVEYTLHPIKKLGSLKVPSDLPITSSKIIRLAPELSERSFYPKINALLSAEKVLRNACTIGQVGECSVKATLTDLTSREATISLVEQYPKPFAMVECKRVGVEEGTKKGPQTIEKAKQGAYVARTVSSLQKVRDTSGTLYGVVPTGAGKFYTKPYGEMISEIIDSKDPHLYQDFIMTVGVVSNHGNWFTSDNPNKELLVLAQAYDWLVFLTDKGICNFIEELLVKPEKEYALVKQAFLSSYQNRATKNQFTKVQMRYDVHLLLLDYFLKNKDEIEDWFNVITPSGSSLVNLRKQLTSLSRKNRQGFQ